MPKAGPFRTVATTAAVIFAVSCGGGDGASFSGDKGSPDAGATGGTAAQGGSSGHTSNGTGGVAGAGGSAESGGAGGTAGSGGGSAESGGMGGTSASGGADAGQDQLPDASAPGDSGADASAGGSIGAGGAVGNGGTVGNGGAVGNGGTVGDGGAVGNGGTVGNGGAVGDGGAMGSGGIVGSGGSGGSGGAGSGGPQLWFTEYVEGTGLTKAVEITNHGAQDSDLTGCQILIHSNGSTAASSTINLSGVLASRDQLVVCGSALSTACDVVTGSLTHNGDDAVELRCSGTTLDVIGQIGSDPGSAWGTTPTITQNATLRRKCAITSGDPNGGDAFDPSTEWDGFPVDTIDDLGKNACSNLFFSEYVEGTSLNRAVEIYNGGSATESLAGCRVEIYANGSPTAGNVVTLPVTANIVPGGTFVVCRQAISAACDLFDTHLEHNGNDAVVLACGTTRYDVIGQVGFNPGTQWGTNPSTLNTTLERKCGVGIGDRDGTDAFDPAVEWTGFPTDTFSGLGSHCP